MSTKEIKTRRQAERALIGAVLLHPAVLDQPGFPPVASADFGAAAHRHIWQAIRTIRAQSRSITPDDVIAEMEAAGAADLSELAGIATALDLRNAIAALALDADPDRVVDHANAVTDMADNLRLADELDVILDRAKVWPPTARSFFCQVFEGLASLFCGPQLAGAR
jgi:replicative DNA helicase